MSGYGSYYDDGAGELELDLDKDKTAPDMYDEDWTEYLDELATMADDLDTLLEDIRYIDRVLKGKE